MCSASMIFLLVVFNSVHKIVSKTKDTGEKSQSLSTAMYQTTENQAIVNKTHLFHMLTTICVEI